MMNRRTSLMLLLGGLLPRFKKTYYNWVDGHEKGGSTGPVLLNGKHILPVLWCHTRRGIVCYIKEDGYYVFEEGTRELKRFYAYGNVEVLEKS